MAESMSNGGPIEMVDGSTKKNCVPSAVSLGFRGRRKVHYSRFTWKGDNYCFSVHSKCSLRPGPVSMGPPASHGPGLDSCEAFSHSLTFSRHADTATLAPTGNFACNQRMQLDFYFDQLAPGVPACREACIGLPRYVSSGAAASELPSGSKTRPRGTRPARRCQSLKNPFFHVV